MFVGIACLYMYHAVQDHGLLRMIVKHIDRSCESFCITWRSRNFFHNYRSRYCCTWWHVSSNKPVIIRFQVCLQACCAHFRRSIQPPQKTIGPVFIAFCISSSRGKADIFYSFISQLRRKIGGQSKAFNIPTFRYIQFIRWGFMYCDRKCPGCVLSNECNHFAYN